MAEKEADVAPGTGEDAAALRALAELAAAWAVPLPPLVAQALLAYGRLLLTWNQRINLTGASSLLALVHEHFVDGFVVASRFPAGAAVVDVGSGGGLPAIPAALLAPTATVCLVEPIRKKGAFLRTALRALSLGGRVSVVDERWDAEPPPDRRARFDVAMSRATFAPDDWLPRATPLVVPGGKVLALATERRQAAPPAGLALDDQVSYGQGDRWLWSFLRST